MISDYRPFVWIIVLCAGALRVQGQVTADELFAEAVKAGQARDFAKSELWLKEMRASFPKDPRAGISLMGVLGEQNKLPEALRLARELAPQFQENSSFHIAHGRLLTRSDRWEEALVEFQAALRSSTSAAASASAHNLIGDAQREIGNLDASIESFRTAKQLLGQPSFMLALVLGMRGDCEAEIAEYREVIRAMPNNDLALNNLAYSLVERGENLDEALVLIRRAVRIAPRSSHAVDTLGWVLYKQGRYAEAEVELVNASLMEGGNQPTIWDHLAAAMDGRAEWTEDRRELRRLLQSTENASQMARLRTLLRKLQ